MVASGSSPRILRPLADLDYRDTRSILLPFAITPLQAWTIITADPRPFLRLAFRTRVAIALLFGVKRIGGDSRMKRDAVHAGDRLDFFLVEHSTHDTSVLTERNRHPDVMICIRTSGCRLSITASVVTHNAFGRISMVPVRAAHQLIVGQDLTCLKRRRQENASKAVGA